MTNINKISIIILTYNNWKYLEDSISSVANQILDSLDYELIISDDASNDFDKSFINNLLIKYELFDKTKIILNPLNLGTVKSFNNAIIQSKGDIIIPLAADDYFYDSNVVKDIVHFFDTNNDALIVTGLQIPFDQEKELSPIISEKKYSLFDSCNSLLKYITSKNNIISGASTYYRKSIFEQYGYFDEKYRLLEDYPFYLKLLSRNCKIYLLERKVIKYRLGGISTSKKVNPQLDNDLRKARKYALSISKINYFSKRKILFKKVFTEKEKKANILKYPEQAILYYLKKF